MLKGHLNNYELNGSKISNEKAVEYAKLHPDTYQVYELSGNTIIRTAKGGFDLEKISDK